jgi:hypothetical protein
MTLPKMRNERNEEKTRCCFTKGMKTTGFSSKMKGERERERETERGKERLRLKTRFDNF